MHFKELHNHKKTARKGSSHNRSQVKRKNKYLVSNNGNGENEKEEVQNDSGYPSLEMVDQEETKNKGTKAGQKGAGGQTKERLDKDAQSQKSGGYSTDVDQLARSKRLLALERSWMQKAS